MLGGLKGLMGLGDLKGLNLTVLKGLLGLRGPKGLKWPMG